MGFFDTIVLPDVECPSCQNKEERDIQTKWLPHRGGRRITDQKINSAPWLRWLEGIAICDKCSTRKEEQCKQCGAAESKGSYYFFTIRVHLDENGTIMIWESLPKQTPSDYDEN
jgi:hypothetical protein